MPHLAEHNHKILRSRVVAKKYIESGLIIEFSYQKLPDKMGQRESKRYLSLVLTYDYEGYMHALNLDYVSFRELNKLARGTGLILSEEIKEIRKLNIPALNIEDPKGFYQSMIKKSPILTSSYRQYNIDRITGSVKAIDYLFTGDIGMKIGGKDDDKDLRIDEAANILDDIADGIIENL